MICTALSTITADTAFGFSRKKTAHRTVLVHSAQSLSIRQLYSTMSTINNCSIVSSTPTYRQQSDAGSTTMYRIDETKFIFGNKNLKAEKVKTGVAQGGDVSPMLFDYYLADIPTPPPKIKLINYADDITIYTSGPVVSDLINLLYIHLSQVLKYIKKLTVSTVKSSVTLFTPDTHKHHLHPQIKLADQMLPLKKKPKVLGMTLDTQLTFAQRCNNITARVQQRNNVLKALTGCT